MIFGIEITQLISLSRQKETSFFVFKLITYKFSIETVLNIYQNGFSMLSKIQTLVSQR